MSSVSRKSPKNDATTILTDNNRNIIKINKKSIKNKSKQSLNDVTYSSTTGNNNIKGNYSNYDKSNFETKNNEIDMISVLDKINLKIIEELLNNGEIKSSEIASKLKIPLSTIQRRRTKIEKTLFRKKYELNLNQMGFRNALIFVDVLKGRAKETGEKLLTRFDRSVLRASTRINSSNNLCLEIVYDNSEQLHFLLEEIKAMPWTSNVDWSEQVNSIGDNVSNIINFALSQKLKASERQKM
jgi:DNA-binding Lrp family transcriptional regulator